MEKKIIRIGIIGGLGPLASASFVETIYTAYLRNEYLKQHYHSPYVYLYSEPLLSQSTSCVMSVTQSEAELLLKLEKNIVHLAGQKMDYLIICCFTAHALLSKLLPRYQAEIYSLVTPILEYVLAQNTPFILLSASSAHEAQVLETHPLWSKTAHKIRFVDHETQKYLDFLINRIKNNDLDSATRANFLELINKFSGHQFIIACAELHILHKKLRNESKKQVEAVFDPFYAVTQNIWSMSV